MGIGAGRPQGPLVGNGHPAGVRRFPRQAMTVRAPYANLILRLRVDGSLTHDFLHWVAVDAMHPSLVMNIRQKEVIRVAIEVRN